MVFFTWFLILALTTTIIVSSTPQKILFDPTNLIKAISTDYQPVKIISGIVSQTNFFDNMIPYPTKSNLITPTIAQAKYYVHFTAAAYCNDPKLSKWLCKHCLATGPDVEFIMVINHPKERTRAYFAINKKVKEIILTYRGTVNFPNIMQDTTVDMIPVTGGKRNTIRKPNGGSGNGIKVHEGAWDDMMSLHDGVKIQLRLLITQYSKYNIIITGHSLGAMMASLALYKLKTDPEFSYLKYSLYTYGQPRTGNLDFALWINSQKIPIIRVVSKSDIVPHATLSSAQYVHHLRELWINNNNEDILCSENILEDPTCSNSKGPNYNPIDHFTYWDTFYVPTECVVTNPISYIKMLF